MRLSATAQQPELGAKSSRASTALRLGWLVCAQTVARCLLRGSVLRLGSNDAASRANTHVEKVLIGCSGSVVQPFNCSTAMKFSAICCLQKNGGYMKPIM